MASKDMILALALRLLASSKSLKKYRY